MVHGLNAFLFMKKNLIRWGVIIVTFLAACLFFSIYLNQGTTDMTVDMTEPSLPVAYIDYDGTYVNEMHGYLTKMDCSTLRDSVTPIGDDREVRFKIDKYGQTISSIKIEVRSADGNRLIEDTQVLRYNDYKDYTECTVELKDLIDKGKEYNLIIVVTLIDDRTVYYYTRVIQNENANPSDKIAFVTDFNNKTFSKDNIKELSAYMEPNSEGDNTTLGVVTIHSNMNQLTWGNLTPRIKTLPSITIEEIGDTMSSLEMKYVVSVVENRTEHFYNITEYYRIRVTSQRNYLLSFNRKMDEIFIMDKSSFANDKIGMGIQSEEIQMMESEDGEILAFENDGRLYCYNATDNKLERLFAFYDTPSDDYRSRYRGAEVKILDVEENGNVAFLVYGYMNRGVHEGEVGVIQYYYNSQLNTIEEQVFIPYYGSQDILRCDIETLSYHNTAGDLFVFIDGVVYRIQAGTREVQVIADNINEDTFFVSKSAKTFVWQDKDEADENNITSNLTVMSLTNGQTEYVEKNRFEYVKPMGFMNEDLIYGISYEDDLIRNKLGDITIPMNRIVIQNDAGDILKEYNFDDIYVTGGEIEGNQITLHRAKKDDSGRLIPIVDDHITNNTEVDPGKNTIEYANTEMYERITQIKLKRIVDTKSLKMLTPREVLYEGGRNVEITNTETKDRFLVYGDGEIVGIYDKVAKAVDSAYEIRGTVTDINGNEIYRRGETVARNQIMAITEDHVTDTKDSLAVCLDAMLKLQGISRNTEYALSTGTSVYDILNANLSDAYILNLTGCTMDMMLYYVNKDIPVLALMNDGSAMLIIGFNEQNIVVMDPERGEIYKIGRNDSREMFESNGNRFMTYAIKNNE